MFGLMQAPQVTMKQSQMAICDPDTKQLIPEGAASMVGWINAAVRSVYPEKRGCLSPLMNVK